MVAAIGLATAAVGAYGASQSGKSSGSTTNTAQSNTNPTLQAQLYGNGSPSTPGLLNSIGAAGTAPQMTGNSQFGNGASTFLGSNGTNILNSQQQAANGLMTSSYQPTNAQIVWNAGATVAAPSQNNLDLSSAYNNVINGNAGANPYLTSALQSAVNTTNDSYNQNQTSLTNQLQRTILPQINQGAALSGQYGGTRQGIAQGNALSDYTNQLTMANQQLADTNSANTTGQQANAYNQGQDRALSALTSLSGQQYATASQNASMAQQANLQNQSVNNSNQQYNAGLGLQAQQLNSANQATGINASQGILGNAYNYATAQNSYPLTQASAAANALAPYSGVGASSSASSPYYTNPLGNAIGGATAGLGLYNAYSQATGSGGSSVPGIQNTGYQNFNVQPGVATSPNVGGVYSGFTSY